MNTIRRVLLKLFFRPVKMTLRMWCREAADRLSDTHQLGHASWIYSGGDGLERIILVLATGDHADKLNRMLCTTTASEEKA